MIKVIVSGCRDFDNKQFIFDKLDELVNDPNMVILHGAARGVDELAEEWAKANNRVVFEYPADWNTHGKAAGPIRNMKMAKDGHILIAFWDGKSKGTKHMIKSALDNCRDIFIIRFDKYQTKDV